MSMLKSAPGSAGPPVVPPLGLSDRQIDELFLLPADGETTARVVQYFKQKYLPAPDRSASFSSGIREYLEECEKNSVVPCSAFIRNLSSTKVNLSHMCLMDAGAFGIARALEINSVITHISLVDNHLKAPGILRIVSSLRTNTILTHLDVSDNDLGSTASLQLAEVLSNNDSLIELGVRNTNLSDPGIIAICDALGYNQRLRKLDAAKNGIGERGARAIREFLQVNITLTDLDLSWNKLQAEGGRLVAEGLSQNNTLSRCDLSFCGIGKEGARIIGETLSNEASALVSLDISYDKVDANAAILIARGLESNNKIKTLHMKFNRIGDRAAKSIMHALENNKTLQDLDLQGCHVSADGSTLFHDNNPTGDYRLQLSVSQDRDIAVSLHKSATTDFGKTWRAARIDGAKVKWTPEFSIPTTGELRLDYRTGKHPTAAGAKLSEAVFSAGCPEPIFKKLMVDLKKPIATIGDRLVSLNMMAHGQYFTTAQCHQILHLFLAEGVACSEEKISALTMLYGRIVDPASIPELIGSEIFTPWELIELRRRLGAGILIAHGNLTRRHKFDLSVVAERLFAMQLLVMGATDRSTNSLSEPDDELVEVQPPAPVVEEVAEGEAAASPSEEAPVAPAPEPLPQLASLSLEHEKRYPLPFGARNLTLNGNPVPRFVIRDGQVVDLPTSGKLVFDYVRGTPAQFGSRCRVFKEAELASVCSRFSSERKLMYFFELVSNSFCVAADVGARILEQFVDTKFRVRIAVALYGRCLNRQMDYWRIFTQLNAAEQKEVSHRIGAANLFDSLHPGRHYTLNLADKWDRRVAQKLLQLGTEICAAHYSTFQAAQVLAEAEGTVILPPTLYHGWQSESLDSMPFSLQQTFSTYQLPVQGILELEFVEDKPLPIVGKNKSEFRMSEMHSSSFDGRSSSGFGLSNGVLNAGY